MNGELQGVILALVVIVPVAILWAFKAKPNDESFSFPPPEEKCKRKKDNYVYDVYVLQRYGKR